MKKILLTFFATIAMLTLVSCNNAAKPNFVIPSEGYDGSAVTISFWSTMSQKLQDIVTSYTAEFNKEYPNITVDHQAIGGYNDVRDQIKTAITVGDQPNLAYCYPDHIALYNKAQAVVTLDDLIKSDIKSNDGIIGLTAEQKADFIEGYYNEGTQFGDGLMYSMPFSKSTEVLYYNKSFFELNNLSVPTTWDEMETVCAQIKQINPSVTPLGYDSESNWFITMCKQYNSGYTSATGENFLFNNDVNKAFVQRFKEWYSSGYVTTQTTFGAYTSKLFVKGTAAGCVMCIGSSAGASNQYPSDQSFEVGITGIPQADAVNNEAVISQGPSVCILKNDNPQEVLASWLYLKYLTTTSGFQAEFSKSSGYAPVIKSVNTVEVYNEFIELASTNSASGVIAQAVKTCNEQGSKIFTSPAFIGSSVARDQVGSLMVAALIGEKSIDQAFADALEECIYQAN